MNQFSESHEPGENSHDVLAFHLEAFLQEWETNGYGPSLAEHLPKTSGSLRRAVLIELIKVDLEYRYNSEGPVLRLEDYLAEHPELGEPDGMPVELIHEEYHLRVQLSGDTIDVDDCIARFPDKADRIRRMFPMEEQANQSLTGDQLGEAWQVGDRIEDFYLISVLGAGAFGCVYLARQESMQRMVALKISGDKGREAQTLAQLDHPGIVRVYDQVRLPEQNLRLLYMQFAAGGTLHAVIKASTAGGTRSVDVIEHCIAEALNHTGVLSSEHVSLNSGLAGKSWAQATCHIGMQLAQALHYAHGQGTLHRDVKPANVLLEANGSAKLADFNISFSSEVEGEDAADSFGGSLAYMSPEQLEACNPQSPTSPHALDARSDVYSLGIVLWEMLYGTRPFADEVVPDNWSATLQGMTKLRRDGVGSVPVLPADATEEVLVRLLRRCLEPDPDRRYQTAAELARELDLCQQTRVARLLQQRDTGWRAWAQAWPVMAVLFTAIAPHVVGAVFNYHYNESKIISNLKPDQQQRFETLVVIINAIAFSIGIGCCVWYSAPSVKGVRRILRGDSEPQTDSRLRSLQLSRFVTILGITEWIIAGIAYPLALYFGADGLGAIDRAHFFGSLLICGLLAAAYPFFLTAALTIRMFVPTLLQHDRLTTGDMTRLRRLSDQSGWSLYLAGGVPAVAMLMILVMTETHADDISLTLLSLLGAIGFGFALSLSRSLQRDIQALQDAWRVPGEGD